jgi:hypothetical protein
MARTTERPRPPIAVAEAATLGALPLLVALRDRLCWHLDQGCAPRDLSPLVLRVLELTRAIDALASDDVSAAPATPDEPWLS